MSHTRQDVLESSDSQMIVCGDCDVVLAMLVRGELHVAANPACYLVSVVPEQTRELRTRQVSRQLHGSIVSSRSTLMNRSRMLSGWSHSPP
jgi:hypothetical protein